METCASLEEYFYNRIQGCSLDGDIQAYLVMILAKWARSQPDDAEPLAIAYMQALQTQGWPLREVADRALWWAGFAPHTMGPLVTRRYVEGIGMAAYAHFAKHASARVFWALSESFSEAVEVVRDISRAHEDLSAMVSRAVAGNGADDDFLERQGVFVLRRR